MNIKSRKEALKAQENITARIAAIAGGCATQDVLFSSGASGGGIGRWRAFSNLGFAVFLLCLIVSSTTYSAPLEWYFYPAGKESHDEIAQLRPDFDKKDWTRVTLPHAFKEPDSFGWYACVVNVPETMKGHDLLLDLGPIDDSDCTYFNGTKVGKMGSLVFKSPSAWALDRRYHVPASVVQYGNNNLIAVQIKNFTGQGGMQGQPYLGMALPQEWACRFLGQDGPLAAMAGEKANEAQWAEVSLPDLQWNSRQKDKPCDGWYRVHFDLPQDMLGSDLLVDLGRIYDVAECYLNGQRVGQMGILPPNTFLETAGRFRCVLPAPFLKAKGNVLAVRIYNDSEFGGWVGVPTVSVADQDMLGKSRTVAEFLQTLNVQPAEPDRLLRLSDYLIHSGQLPAVLDLSSRILSNAHAQPTQQRRAEENRIYALWLSGRGEEAWKEFLTLDFSVPIPYSVATAMAQQCRKSEPPAQGVLYLGKDTQLQGDWDFRYGLSEACLCAVHTPYDDHYGTDPGLQYKLATGVPEEKPKAWLGTKETGDRRALWYPLKNTRRYASWDDHGETRPFDDNGPDLILNLSVPGGPRLITFYLVDWDWYAGEHPRMETVIVLDENQKPLTIASTGKFGSGVYQLFLVEGPKNITLRFSKHRGPCAVVSGMFMDKALPLQALPYKGPPTALDEKYTELAKATELSVLGVLQQGLLAQLEKGLSGLKPGTENSTVYWYLAECRRIKGDLQGAQEALTKYFTLLGDEVPPGEKDSILRQLARQLDHERYRPEAILVAMRAVALVHEGEEQSAFAGMLKTTQLAVVKRLSARWQSVHPFPVNGPERTNIGGQDQ